MMSFLKLLFQLSEYFRVDHPGHFCQAVHNSRAGPFYQVGIANLINPVVDDCIHSLESCIIFDTVIDGIAGGSHARDKNNLGIFRNYGFQ